MVTFETCIEKRLVCSEKCVIQTLRKLARQYSKGQTELKMVGDTMYGADDSFGFRPHLPGEKYQRPGDDIRDCSSCGHERWKHQGKNLAIRCQSCGPPSYPKWRVKGVLL